MEAPLAACAPNKDLHLLKILANYENINKKISKASSTKLAASMWYLSEELEGLVLFDKNVSNSIKEKSFWDWQTKRWWSTKESPNKRTNNQWQWTQRFVTFTWKVLLQKLNILTSFLDKDSEFWREDDNFLIALTIVHELIVVNDHAELGVALILKNCSLLTKEKEQQQ